MHSVWVNQLGVQQRLAHATTNPARRRACQIPLQTAKHTQSFSFWHCNQHRQQVFSICVQTHQQVCRAKTTSAPLNYWAARYNTWLLMKLAPKGVVFSLQGCVIKGAGAWGCHSSLAWHNSMRYDPSARQLPC